jgi:4-hydroxybenzoate polyprenyltransferase
VEGESLVIRYINLVRLPHTVFALPFALLGVVYASMSAPVTVRTVALVVLAFTAARFAAMGFNRIADRKIDGANPRTAARELPSGRLSLTQAVAAVVVASAIFVGAAALLNRVCLWLSPLALAWILSYSFAKRFTSWSHVWLGASLSIAPAGGYLAVASRWSTPAWPLLALATAVMAWVAGFDIFYALQDEQFDHAHGLKSAVVRLGQQGSILSAKLLHGVSIAALAAFGVGAGFGAGYWVGLGIAAVVIAWEHQLVRPGDLRRLDAAFFTMNGIVSIVIFLGALGDRVL